MIRLSLGHETIASLLPHRDPIRLVETIEGFAPGKAPRLRATLGISGDEPVLAGHFPGEPIWPGAYVLEGLAQCGGLLLALQAVHARGGEAALTALGDAASADALGGPRRGALARAQIDLLQPIRPPATLRYEVRLLGEYGMLFKLDGHASVADRAVAQASLSIALYDEDAP